MRDSIARGLWVLPLCMSLASGALGIAAVTFDRHVGHRFQLPFAYGGGPSNAMSVLGTIAAAVLSFTGLVFSIVIVALQLASSQYSPRVMRTFLRDRGTRVTLGIFVGTFVYTLTVLQSIRAGEATAHDFVPANAVSLAIVFVLVTVGAFVYFVHHMSVAIRVTWIIESVAAETRAAIEAEYPSASDPALVHSIDDRRDAVERADALAAFEHSSPHLVGAPVPGVITGYYRSRLVDLASSSDALIEAIHAVGDFVPEGAPLLRVSGTVEPDAIEAARKAVGIAPERTMRQDVAFGFRQLVDIAERALSPAVNDPTTAVQALDRIHDLLRRLAHRPFPTGVLHDSQGRTRVVIPVPTWEDLVNLALVEIRFYGESSVQITRRIRAVLDDLIDFAPPTRRGALEAVSGEWERAMARNFVDPISRARARIPDAGGLGSDDVDEPRRATTGDHPDDPPRGGET